jgi:hypothetical protein
MSLGGAVAGQDIIGGGAEMTDVVDRAADGGRAEQHVAVARQVACIAGAVGVVCPDDEIVEAVAVDIAGP